MKEGGLREENRGQILSRSDRTNEVNKEFITWLLPLSTSLLTKLSVLELLAQIYLLVFTYYFVVFCIYSSSFLLKIVENI